MLIDHIELTDYSDVSPFNAWIENHPNAIIQRIISSGPHFYIWYIE